MRKKPCCRPAQSTRSVAINVQRLIASPRLVRCAKSCVLLGIPSVSQAASSEKPRRPRGPAEASPRAVVPTHARPWCGVTGGFVGAAREAPASAAQKRRPGPAARRECCPTVRRSVGRASAARPRAAPSHRSPHDDDGGHGPAPHPVIKTERLAHYYK